MRSETMNVVEDRVSRTQTFLTYVILNRIYIGAGKLLNIAFFGFVRV